MRVLGLLLLLASSSQAEPECTADSDCTMSTFVGCCEACPSAPQAWSKKVLAARQQICAVVDCTIGTKKHCAPVPKTTEKAARCVEHACVAR